MKSTRKIKMYIENPKLEFDISVPALVLVEKTFTLKQLHQYNRDRKHDSKIARWVEEFRP